MRRDIARDGFLPHDSFSGFYKIETIVAIVAHASPFAKPWHAKFAIIGRVQKSHKAPYFLATTQTTNA